MWGKEKKGKKKEGKSENSCQSLGSQSQTLLDIFDRYPNREQRHLSIAVLDITGQFAINIPSPSKSGKDVGKSCRKTS